MMINVKVTFGFLNTPRFPEPNYLVRNGKSYDIFSMGSHETRLFRDGMIFGLPKLMREMYVGETDVLCYGSSGGHEPCSLGVTLTEEFGSLDEVKKRFHIHAMDINPSLVEFGKDGLIVLSKIDVDCFDVFDRVKFVDFFANPEPVNNKRYGDILYPVFSSEEYRSYEIKKELKDLITFSCADLVNDLKNGNPLFEKPVVFMFRNAWFNFQTLENTKYMAELLHCRLKPNSLVVLGETEANWFWQELGKRTTMTEVMEVAGFKHMPQKAKDITTHMCKEGYLFLRE